MKPLSKLFAPILSAVKTGLLRNYEAGYSRDGVNQMWILKNSNDLLEYTQSRSLSCNVATCPAAPAYEVYISKVIR